jgi:hypothetical protein
MDRCRFNKRDETRCTARAIGRTGGAGTTTPTSSWPVGGTPGGEASKAGGVVKTLAPPTWQGCRLFSKASPTRCSPARWTAATRR